MSAEPSTESLSAALRRVPDPDRGGDIVASGAVRELRLEGGKARFLLALVKPSGETARIQRTSKPYLVVWRPLVKVRLLLN